MKLSTILAGATVLATTAIAISPASADVIDRRQNNQAKRIEQGVKSGQLTWTEAAKLKQQQAYIRELERQAERDGRVTRAEKARIAAAQNAANRAIYAEKHDNQVRNQRRWYKPWSLGKYSHDNQRRWWFWSKR